MCIVAFLMAFVAGTVAQTADPGGLQVKELTLSNGLTVWINEDRSQPKVYGAVVVKAGAVDCPNTGIAHYFEHMMFKGTDRIGTVDYAAERPWLDSISVAYDRLAETRDEEQRLALQHAINRLSEKAADYVVPNDFNNLTTRFGGSQLNAATSYDYTFYHNVFSPQYLRQWAMLNSERMINPVFRLFQNELETVYEEKNLYADDMLTQAMERLMERAFEGTPYQYPIIGSTENLKNPQLSQMKAFFDRYYVASNMGLILAGDIQTDDLLPLLEETFGRLPKGETKPSVACQMPPYCGETCEVKVPIPVIAGELLAFHGPTAGSPDADALMLAMRLLYNEDGTGMLDSLTNEGKLLAAVAFSLPQRRVGLLGLGIVPNLLGKKSKAETLCRNEVVRLKRGEFSDEALALVKRGYERERLTMLENLEMRAAQMVSVFATTDLSWNEYVVRSKAIHDIDRTEILRVANKYLNDHYLRFVKKYGSYKKDHLKQPGYKPIVPKNNGRKSAYADVLDRVPCDSVAPRFLRLADDAQMVQLSPLAQLYTVDNPVDSLFRIDITYYKGTREDRQLDYAAEYVNELGTDSLTRIQLLRSLQQLGAIVEMEAKEDVLRISMTGHDHQLQPSLQLLDHYLTHAKADEKKFKELKRMASLGVKSFDKDANTVARAMLKKLAFGSKSEYLCSPTLKEVKEMTSEALLRSLSEARHRQFTVAYSGTLPTAQVAQVVRQTLHPEWAVEPRTDRVPSYQPAADKTVYVYTVKDARQNIVGTYQQLSPTPTWDDVADRRLFAHYFAGDMSSVMFQEIREFRSYAYSVGGATGGPVQRTHPDGPTMLVTMTNTQTDKTLQTIAVLDSLMTDMPFRSPLVDTARRSLSNELVLDYPNFRDKGGMVARLRLNGYDADPNAMLYEALQHKTTADVERYFNSHVKTAPRTLFIIGKLSKSDLEALGKYGRVVMLEKRDLINY